MPSLFPRAIKRLGTRLQHLLVGGPGSGVAVLPPPRAHPSAEEQVRPRLRDALLSSGSSPTDTNVGFLSRGVTLPGAHE